MHETVRDFEEPVIMRGDHDEPPGLHELTQQSHDGVGVDRVEVRRRLVGQQQRGLADEGAGECDALLLSAGKASRPESGAVGKPDTVESRKCPCARPGGGASR